jgi:hypothetical protein
MRDKMTFKELLNKVVFDDVWVTLQKDYSMKNEASEAYCESIGYVDELTTEEIELQHEQFKRIAADNEKIYEMLLSPQTRGSVPGM